MVMDAASHTALGVRNTFVAGASLDLQTVWRNKPSVLETTMTACGEPFAIACPSLSAAFAASLGDARSASDQTTAKTTTKTV